MSFAAIKRACAFAALLALVLGLAGCASDPSRLPLGVTRAQALQQLGTPTSIFPMPDGGERLQYSRGPMGFQVNNVDLDAHGRVIAVTQEMQDALFDRTIKVNVWREEDILRTYGRPFEISRVLAFEGNIWSYRYLAINQPRWLYIYVDPDGLVVRWHTADELRRVMTLP